MSCPGSASVDDVWLLRLKTATVSDMRGKRGIGEAVWRFAEAHPQGEPFAVRELLHLGQRTAIDKALSRLVRAGRLMRVTRGIYVRPEMSRFFGAVAPNATKVAVASARSRGEVLASTGATALNRFGLSTQVPVVITYLTTGRSRILRMGALAIHFKHTSAKRIPFGDTAPGDALTALRYLGRDQVNSSTLTAITSKLTPSQTKTLRTSRKVPAWIRAALRSIDSPAPHAA